MPLQDLSKYYDLHVYTIGTKSYAFKVLSVLDPDQKVFRNGALCWSVFSLIHCISNANLSCASDKSISFSSKSDKRLFSVGTSMVVVVDDGGYV